MSAREEATARILAALPHVAPEMLRHARQEWKPQSVMRQVLKVEADRLVRTIHGKLETCTPEELKDFQGQIQGVKDMLAAANAQGDA